MVAKRIFLVLLSASLLLALSACPAGDDEGPPGETLDTGRDSTTGADGSDTGGDALDLPEELFGEYSFVSVTLEELTITTSNQDFGGVDLRAEGMLTLESDGTYSRYLNFYQDDILDETESGEGTWSVDTPGVVTIDEDGSAPFNATYTYQSGTLTLTPTTDGSTTMTVDEIVYAKI